MSQANKENQAQGKDRMSMRPCATCGKTGHTKTFCYRNRKPIRKKGKRTLEYERWRDEVAKPYLDMTYGRQCNACKGARCGNQQLDVDHVLNRGSHPSQRMNLDNVQYLGRYPCHVEKTNGKVVDIV